jgi:hypothetical protein
MSRRYELSAFRFSASMAASYTSTIPEVGALISPVEHSPYSVKWGAFTARGKANSHAENAENAER